MKAPPSEAHSNNRKPTGGRGSHFHRQGSAVADRAPSSLADDLNVANDGVLLLFGLEEHLASTFEQILEVQGEPAKTRRLRAVASR
jgi:hypothetical protein